jgi:hypothetical protein
VYDDNGREVAEFSIDNIRESKTFQVRKRGVYNYTINDSACGVLSHHFEIEQKNPAEKNLIVYPNPLSNKSAVNISGPGLENALLKVYSENGSLVATRKVVDEAGTQLSVESYHSGLYVVEVILPGGEILIEKLLIR